MKALKPVITINIPGPPRKNLDTMLRAVAEDFTEEAVVATVNAMLEKPADYAIGSKRRTSFSKARKRQPALRGDEEEKIPGTVEKIAEKAFT